MAAYLLDTNILLRSVQREAPHHPLAIEALATLLEQEHDVFITAQNLIEFWSVASRPTEANGLGWTTETVRQEVDRLRAQFPMLDDTADVFVQWLQLVSAYRVSGRRVHDARLVAVMLAHGITHLLTFNQDDFRHFEMITVVTPMDVLAATEESSG
jgi:predicted nucleic acid-binding protein